MANSPSGSIAAGQTISLDGDIRTALTLGAGSVIFVAPGAHLSLFAGIVARGSVTIVVAAGATLFAPGPMPATVAITLEGAGSVLALAASTLGTFAAIVAGFTPGSVIDIAGARITAVVRRGKVAGLYGLTLNAGATTLGTILVGAGLPGAVLAVPDGIDGSNLLNGPAIGAPTPLAPAETGPPRAYTWVGGANASWSGAANWSGDDGGPVVSVPGARDSITLAGAATRFLTVAGAGTVDSLRVMGAVAIAGPVTSAAVLIGRSGTDALVITAGSHLTAGSVTLAAGDLIVQGGTLDCHGLLELSGTLDLLSGGMVRAAAMRLGTGLLRMSTDAQLVVGSDTRTPVGSITIGPGATLAASGTIDAPILLDGTLEVIGGTLALFGAVTGAGTIDLDPGATLFAAAATGPVAFPSGAGATLEILTGVGAGAVLGFGTADVLDLAGVIAAPPAWDPAGTLDLGTLGRLTLTLAAGIDPSLARFDASPDGQGGTAIRVIPCFTAATLLRGEGGLRTAGDVRPGEWLMTASGPARRVTWVGRTLVESQDRAAHPQLDPVRIRQGAFGATPVRDLLVSPEHALLITTPSGRRLVPAVALLDGHAIDRARGRGKIDYVHIAFDQHDAVLAEGVACETFLVASREDPRATFARSMGPRPPVGPPLAPRVSLGPELELIRSQLGLSRATRPMADLRGNLDRATRLAGGWLLSGWATGSTRLTLLADGRPVASLLPNGWRADLEHAGIDSGHAAFAVSVPHLPPETRLSLLRA